MSPDPNRSAPGGEDDDGDGRKPASKSKSYETRLASTHHSASTTATLPTTRSVSSLVDKLLSDIYGKSERKSSNCWSWAESDSCRARRSRSNPEQVQAKLRCKGVEMIREEIAALESLIAEESTNLVKYLKRKDFLLTKREAYCNVITAAIQAVSNKTREDMKMKFSLAPGTETGFSQWLDAMKMVAQLPGGVPPEFRTKLWLQLSERHLTEQNIDWEKAEAVIFNEWTNPDDEELGVQIVKDLHRTGCSLFCGAQEQNQALLKRVLLAYARWNKSVGYCQGFNMLAALILQVMDRDEKNAVKVMIYLIEGVLPESYFANNLRGLSVDMAVFRDLLRLRLPKLSKHLEALQNDTNTGTSYEPPLTNVFTMQWFLTLFSNCLPQQTVLRVWDLVFLHGNEVLLRTALAIWGILQDRIMSVESADEFYSIMGVVTREMLEFGLMDANNLVKMIVMVDPFPNELQELREKYLYNISPWTQSVQSAARKGIKLFYSDPEDQDDTEDEDKIALATAYGVFRRRESTSREIQPAGPTLDISVLKQQYARLRERQRQAHIIISAACSSNLPANLTSVPTVSVNHLLMGKSALINKGRRIGPPEGSIPPPKNRSGTAGGGKKEMPVVSGETLEWKDAEKRRMSNGGRKSGLNGLKNGRLGEDEITDEFPGRKRRSSTSSGSSTSTELCDEDSHHLSDFDLDDANPDASPKHTSPQDDTDRRAEIERTAASLIDYITDEVQRSERLKHLRREDSLPSPAPSTSSHDNTKQSTIFDRDLVVIQDDVIVRKEPEVPTTTTAANRATVDEAENRIFDRSKVDGDRVSESGKPVKDRRKSELASSVIKENLEMLSKFMQKAAAGRSDGREDEKAAVKSTSGRRGEDEEEDTVKERRRVLDVEVTEDMRKQKDATHKQSKVEEDTVKGGRESLNISKDKQTSSGMKIMEDSIERKERTVSKMSPKDSKTSEEAFTQNETPPAGQRQEEKISKHRQTVYDVKSDVKEFNREDGAKPFSFDKSEAEKGLKAGEEPTVRNLHTVDKNVKITEVVKPAEESKRKSPETVKQPLKVGVSKEEMPRTVHEAQQKKSVSDVRMETKVVDESPLKRKEFAQRRSGDLRVDEDRPTVSEVVEEGPRKETQVIREPVNECEDDVPARKMSSVGQNVEEKAVEVVTKSDKETMKPSESLKPVKVNKEVNTDITIAADVETSPYKTDLTKSSDDYLVMSLVSVHKSPERFKPEKLGHRDDATVAGAAGVDSGSSRSFAREDLAERWKKESERLESKIEMSKSDWDLKMRRIAELETTTREKLREMKSKSIVHRHRSLDRYDNKVERERRRSPVPRIEVPVGDDTNGTAAGSRRKNISALSFDEITSRTEKLLGGGDATGWRGSLAPEPHRKTEPYEIYSSPTSPENRGRRYGEYSSPKRYQDTSRWKPSGDEDWLTITEESGGRVRSVDLVTSPGRRTAVGEGRGPTGFNPFPTRTVSRPKELGVRLGMYPPTDGPPQKS